MYTIQPQPGTDITQALEAALVQYGAVLIAGQPSPADPPYLISDVLVPSQSWVCGAGIGVTRIKRIANAGAGFTAQSTVGARFSDFSLDINAGLDQLDYDTGINLLESEDATVDRVEVETSTVPSVPSPTIYGIIGKACKGLVVRNCVVKRCQIKVNGGSENVSIVKNTITDGLNYGIAALTRTADQTIRGIVIMDNTVINAYAGGIFVGADGDATGHGKAYGVTIERNTVITGDYDQGFGILFRHGEDAEDVSIVGNKVSSLYPTDATKWHSSACRVKPIDIGAAPIRGLVIAHNEFRHSDLFDLDAFVEGATISISDNILEGGRGLRVFARDLPSMVTIARLTSLPRSTFKSITLVGNGALLQAVNAWAAALPGGVAQSGTVTLTTVQ